MRRAYAVALGLVGSPEDARDLSQEAFARAFRAREKLDPERPFYVWIHVILRRLCFNFNRDRRTRRDRLDHATPWLVDAAETRRLAATPDHELERKELRRRLASALEELPEREREVFVLKEFEGMRYREIAELMDVPIGTVTSRLWSARQRLARALEESR
jgi:RNA polymerase sigma-70 factor (ECF subfamily)